MKPTTHIAVLLLLAFPAAAFAQKSAPKPSYGPSWFAENYNGDKKRPEKVTRISIAADHDKQESKAELSMKFWADLPVETGHTYELRIQYRPHTTLKEPNKVLGTKERTDGIAYTVAKGKAESDWNGLEGRFTIKIQELETMTNRPGFNVVDDWFCLAIEPQIYDLTSDKYVTRPMAEGYLTMMHVKKSDIVELVPLADWIAVLPWADKGYQDQLVSLLPNVKNYAIGEIDLESSFEFMLKQVKDNDDALAKFVAAIPEGWLHPKATLRELVETYADKGSPVLKAAAAKRLGRDVGR